MCRCSQHLPSPPHLARPISLGRLACFPGSLVAWLTSCIAQRHDTNSFLHHAVSYLQCPVGPPRAAISTDAKSSLPVAGTAVFARSPLSPRTSTVTDEVPLANTSPGERCRGPSTDLAPCGRTTRRRPHDCDLRWARRDGDGRKAQWRSGSWSAAQCEGGSASRSKVPRGCSFTSWSC